MKKIILIFLLLNVILWSACNDDTKVPQDSTAVQLSDFPFSVGNHWQYLRVNNFDTDTRDTVDCYVYETDTLINGKEMLLFQYEDNQSIFLQEFVEFEADTIRFYSKFGQVKYYFAFPMNKGDKWPASSPNLEVLEDNSAYNAFGYDYDSTTLVQFIAEGFNYELLEKYHIKKDIGIVVRIIDEYNGINTKKETWILMDYD